MRNLLLSVALIAAPVAVFSGAYMVMAPASAVQAATPAGSSLGDMSAFVTIINDVESISAKGDFTAAEKRITDFETAWDNAQATLRPINKAYWGNIDDAADAALSALRAKTPEAAAVNGTLADLQTALADPSLSPTNASKGVASVAGIAVTDENGRALPCEVMLKDVAAGLASAKLAPDVLAQATDFQTKALERCNADDDTRADGFSAQALALLAK
ncbi:hypothetical protein [Pseudorhodobacter sp.]|uniref:hypothetical protein n=1 Tax=Pseudorhodobacter sp. TaxID=1934400 RepID=UPI0026477E40|nr:hypothetical protein [Pseudorhodobacter sp.]MDN5787082.1 hypothetical protein [Pseudorhodobacter sp.]